MGSISKSGVMIEIDRNWGILMMSCEILRYTPRPSNAHVFLAAAIHAFNCAKGYHKVCHKPAVKFQGLRHLLQSHIPNAILAWNTPRSSWDALTTELSQNGQQPSVRSGHGAFLAGRTMATNWQYP